jgi:metal-responsive CopG/Arc/MetJ family transcriptional regulator
VQVRLQPDLLAALDRFISEEKPDVSRPEALRTAFKDWAVAHGYLHPGDEGIRPEDLNASNDD